ADVAALKNTLAISFASGDSATSVTKNITLPSGSNGVSVTWSSSNAAVISNAGVVTRPAYTGSNANVTLTATLSKGSASDTKTFALTVLKEAAPVDTSSEDLAALKEALALTFADGDSATSVTSNITLPSGSNGVNVTWSSSNTSVVANNGTVTRPAFADGNATVTLTATLSKGTASDTKAFNVTVLALAPYSYTVTFDSQNADTAASPASITVTEPATTVASLPSAPLKDGYTFGGWFTEENGSGTEFTASTVVSGNVTVYAKWTAVSPADTSAEDVAAAKSALAITFADGDSATSVASNITLPSGSNGVSVTWSSSNTSVVANNGTVTRPAFVAGNASVTLTATLTKGTASDTKAFSLTVLAVAPYVYTVTFDSQSADTAASPASITVTEPATTVASLPSAPSKDGYTFGGWFTQANGNGTQFTTSTVATGNITVYAKWTAVAQEQYAYALKTSGRLYKRSLTPDSSWSAVDSEIDYSLENALAISIQ
nr:InlB B-repeat-containing protein [Treponemataceae bacterium]